MLRRLLVPILALIVLSAWSASWGQTYPSRPVHIIVAAGTGGPDSIARLVAAQLTLQTGQPFLVENRPGANGILGAEAVAKAAPDGYTLLVYSSGFVINPSMYRKLPYDTEKDFIPVTNLALNGGLFITVHPSVPAKTLQELIELGRKPDSRLSFSSPGIGNTLHLAGEMFNARAGTHMVHVPYKGGGPATAALLAGDVQVMFASPPNVLNQIKAGRLRALAYTTPKRAAALPDVPTTAEAGLPSFLSDGGWYGMFAPANTPADIVDKLYREVRAAMTNPQTREKILGLGIEPVGNSPAEFRQFVSAEIRSYAEMVRIAGIQPE